MYKTRTKKKDIIVLLHILYKHAVIQLETILEPLVRLVERAPS